MTVCLSVRDRWRIISLYFDQNVLPFQIAVIIDCSIPTVRRILRLYDETSNITESEGHNRSIIKGCRKYKSSYKNIQVNERVYTLLIGIISFDVFI